MPKLLDYKCPHCGGAVRFDSASRMVKCPFCESVFTPEEYDETVHDTTAQPAPDAADVVTYSCSSCGGEIVCTGDTVASECPFCDSPVVVAGNVSGEFRPDIIVPFRLDKEQAKQAYRTYLKGKRLLPKVFRSENHIDEIKGVYVPMWTFDVDADATANFDATQVRTWTSGSYRYTATQTYAVSGSDHFRFVNLPVPSTDKVSDELLDAVVPFDFSTGVPFDASYLAGYCAHRRIGDTAQAEVKADSLIEKNIEDTFRWGITGYNTMTLSSLNISNCTKTPKYALYPVWILNTTWQGERYTFVMNAQTGTITGALPMDKKLYRRWYAGIAAIAAVISFIIMALMSLM